MTTTETPAAETATTLLTDATATTPEGATTPPEAAAASEPTDASATTEPAAAPVYEFTLPDGMALDTALVEQVTPLFAKANVPADVAQEMVSTYAAHVAAQTAAALDAQQAAFQQKVAGWADAVKADPEIGGANLPATINAGKRVLAQFGDAETTALLDESGLGNHPSIIRLFAKIGRQLTEDTVVRGSTGATEQKPEPGARIYTTMRKEA